MTTMINIPVAPAYSMEPQETVHVSTEPMPFKAALALHAFYTFMILATIAIGVGLGQTIFFFVNQGQMTIDGWSSFLTGLAIQYGACWLVGLSGFVYITHIISEVLRRKAGA